MNEEFLSLTNINYHELRKTLSYALIAGADSLLLNRFLAGGRGISYQDELSLSHDQIRGMLDTAEDTLAKTGRKGGAGTEIPFCVLKKYTHLYKHLNIGFLCAAAKRFFVVDPCGIIRACNHSPRKTGHIFSEPLIDDVDYWNIFAGGNYIPQVCSHCTDISICDCGFREAANITWYHKDDQSENGYRRSFRSAGSHIAVMEGKDKYTKWYCSGPYETISEYIAQKMASKGWRYEPDGEDPCL